MPSMNTNTLVKMNEPDFLAEFTTAQYRLVPISGGLSNYNFCLHTNEPVSQVFFVRKYGLDYKTFGNCPEREYQMQSQAAQQGLAPHIHFSSAQGMVTDWVEGHHWTSTEKKQPHNIQRLATLVANLHLLPAPNYQLDLTQRLRHYFQQIEPGFKTPLFLSQYNFTLAIIENKLASNRVGFCHHDINPLNVLISNEGRLWLLDWEFAAQGNCDFDIITLLQTFGWDDADQRYFLTCYNAKIANNDRGLSEVDEAQLVYMAIVVNMMALCWAIIMQQAHPSAGYLPFWQQSAIDLAKKINEISL